MPKIERLTRAMYFPGEPRGHTIHQDHQKMLMRDTTITKFSGNFYLQVRVESRSNHRAWPVNNNGKTEAWKSSE